MLDIRPALHKDVIIANSTSTVASVIPLAQMCQSYLTTLAMLLKDQSAVHFPNLLRS